ncbi:hypothetical protein ACN6MY_01275 [Peribacillus sp. B-H-3]|uniref:hypothetical protein n=1 Tax=Peribacillus sp. B-H-3 TaxID=3400420 RepID=UPI003B026C86
MKKPNSSEIQRGQAITFRIPSDVPDHILRQLQKLKEKEKRNFSSKVAEYVLDGVGNESVQDREMISIPLPQKLNKSQRDWLKHAHSEAMLGSILFQLLSDPLRATSLLASLNSSALEIDEALYLQDHFPSVSPSEAETETVTQKPQKNNNDQDLDDFDWSSLNQDSSGKLEEEQEQEESLDDLLGDFLAQMNK